MKNLTKIHPSKVFYGYIYPVFAREFLIECDRFENFAQLIEKQFKINSRQWEAILTEWELKEQVIN